MLRTLFSIIYHTCRLNLTVRVSCWQSAAPVQLSSGRPHHDQPCIDHPTKKCKQVKLVGCRLCPSEATQKLQEAQSQLDKKYSIVMNKTQPQMRWAGHARGVDRVHIAQLLVKPAQQHASSIGPACAHQYAAYLQLHLDGPSQALRPQLEPPPQHRRAPGPVIRASKQPSCLVRV